MVDKAWEQEHGVNLCFKMIGDISHSGQLILPSPNLLSSVFSSLPPSFPQSLFPFLPSVLPLLLTAYLFLFNNISSLVSDSSTILAAATMPALRGSEVESSFFIVLVSWAPSFPLMKVSTHTITKVYQVRSQCSVTATKVINSLF